MKTAMIRWTSALRDATPSYLKDAIDSLDPPDNCPGEQMTIFGHGLGDGTRSAVAFTRDGGGVILAFADSVSVLEWTDSSIRLVMPNGAIRGPVGILVFPVSSASFATAGSDALAEIGGCFGPEVVGRMQQVLGKVVAPPIPAPTAQANRANIYTGGPPVIDYFIITPHGPLWPGRTIRLSWSIVGADQIEIVARNVAGSAPQELPAIPGPLPYVSGGVSVTVPGSRAWRGQYVLRAKNRCTGSSATESTINLEMVLRRGLVLGGGGTRGDFQVGALLYLYDEKGYRPDAIVGTSVGSINAINLVMGDDAATTTSPARSAAGRLAATWRSDLVDETSMWGEEQWLTVLKPYVRFFVRSLSIEGLLSFPIAFPARLIDVKDLNNAWVNTRNTGTVALFNLGPIEALARGQYVQTRTDNSGIKLRLVAVSVETGELVTVDETGAILARGELPIRPSTVAPAPPTDVVDGAIASSAMPGIFPARRLADHMCVDGGVKDVYPSRSPCRSSAATML